MNILFLFMIFILTCGAMLGLGIILGGAILAKIFFDRVVLVRFLSWCDKKSRSQNEK